MNVTSNGIHLSDSCSLDPTTSVEKAIVSHAHADHGAAQSKEIHCTPSTKKILHARFNQENIISHDFEEPFEIEGYKITFYPAGHVLGSAMIHVDNGGKTWLYTGDFKVRQDNTTKQPCPVMCDTLITETTFALPIYTWPGAQSEAKKIVSWYKRNKQNNVSSVLLCYSLGKAQRVLNLLSSFNIHVHCHRTVRDMNKCYEDEGVELGTWSYHSLNKPLGTKLFIAPKQVQRSKRVINSDARIGFVSGWMHVRGRKSWGGYDAGFTISDHADWNELCNFVKACSPKEVIGVHGYTDIFEKYCEETLL